MENTQPNVNIVNGKLILSLPNAQIPVVWQMDFTNAQATAFSVQENKADKNFTLITKSEDDNINEIAFFDDKKSAVEILMAISNALQNSSGATNNNIEKVSTKKNKDNKIGAALALTLVVILVLIWSVSSKNRNIENNGISSSIAESTTSNNRSGVAVSADDFLSNR